MKIAFDCPCSESNLPNCNEPICAFETENIFKQPQHCHVFVDHCARPNLRKWSTSTLLCFSMLWLQFECQKQNHYNKNPRRGDYLVLAWDYMFSPEQLIYDMLFMYHFNSWYDMFGRAVQAFHLGQVRFTSLDPSCHLWGMNRSLVWLPHYRYYNTYWAIDEN